MARRFDQNPIFSIVFKRGMANRHRLPLAHVIATLREVEVMIREVGQKIQRVNGVENADGDFGIVLLANADGLVFKKGSLYADSALTRDIDNGVETLAKIINITDSVEKKDVRSVDQFGESVLRRLTNISSYQEKDKTELQFRLNVRKEQPQQSSFSSKGIEVLREMGKAELQVEAVTLDGMLQRLMYFSADEEGHYFWGGLREDNGNDWRVRFPISDLQRVQKLFTKQVIITGNATHFKTKSPRIDSCDITEEKPRDYLAAFDRFRSEYSNVFGDEEPEKLLEEMRG
jgi:hypothetical protein